MIESTSPHHSPDNPTKQLAVMRSSRIPLKEVVHHIYFGPVKVISSLKFHATLNESPRMVVRIFGALKKIELKRRPGETKFLGKQNKV
jgi:hypothetical protein